jgi:hypothetical protein
MTKKISALWHRIPASLREKGERVAVTVAIMAISILITKVGAWQNEWALLIAFVLNSAKVILAGYVGDGDTGGFVDSSKPDA